MDSGLYTSAAGMLDQYNVEDNISNNLANMQTPGYKERTAVEQNFSRLLATSQAELAGWPSAGPTSIGRFGAAPQISNYGLNLAQGNPRYTGSPLDMMIVGNGFFTVRAGNETLLTRNGSFHRSADGTLVTAEGYRVLGTGGQPLKVPRGTIEVHESGQIQVDGRRVGRLALASVPVGQPLTETANGYYRGPGQPLPTRGPQTTGVLQGYLEGSNVDMSAQMTEMLAAQRAYQADSRMMQMQDDATGLAVNDLGKVGS